MRIFVKSLYGNTYTVELDETTSVEDILEKSRKEEMKSGCIIVIQNGKMVMLASGRVMFLEGVDWYASYGCHAIVGRTYANISIINNLIVVDPDKITPESLVILQDFKGKGYEVAPISDDLFATAASVEPELVDLFDSMHPENYVAGQSKTEILNGYCEQFQVEHAHIYYFGESEGEVEALVREHFINSYHISEENPLKARLRYLADRHGVDITYEISPCMIL